MKISLIIKIIPIAVLSGFYVVLLCAAAGAETDVNAQWSRLETENTIIEYQTLHDLKKFNSKIRYLPERVGIEFLSSGIENDKLKYKIRKKVDALYNKVQKILGMNHVINRSKIILCKNKAQLNEAYSNFNESSRSAYGDQTPPKAWYIYELNTIYVNVDDLHEGILAHEMAHSIIDNYLFVRPPEPTAEILARYVDSHLFTD